MEAGLEAIPFPAKSHSTSGSVQGAHTDVTCISFSDKICITVSQAGRINHWVHVPLVRPAPSDLISLHQPPAFSEDGPDSSLLPFNRLTATTVLGGTKAEYEVTGQTLATTVASAILMRSGEEQRTLVMGLGLAKADIGREAFDGLVGLCLDVI
ncbi:hypothetical protein K461DRAFT_93695 [Myriangium duriaei CBS 260.36]|uniref:Proteasome assembly chaperone 3 n=1 Tax=Myriangium duriaei CBS 260.36 TaxID=1168546 RepID=A0A9P4JCD6_9PEZI|nr:hypothetical protein K461DRAFT_93695 [Myriangium duriaei CBS 260.36]